MILFYIQEQGVSLWIICKYVRYHYANELYKSLYEEWSIFTEVPPFSRRHFHTYSRGAYNIYTTVVHQNITQPREKWNCKSERPESGGPC
jgi:hypothetical protein